MVWNPLPILSVAEYTFANRNDPGKGPVVLGNLKSFESVNFSIPTMKDEADQPNIAAKVCTPAICSWTYELVMGAYGDLPLDAGISPTDFNADPNDFELAI